MSKFFITTLIDTYNHEQFIEDSINSVLNQGLAASEMEVLVVDDGSTDRTADIVRKFAPRVRLLRKPNGGQASAFNAGISESCGQILFFLDGDDWWAPGKVAAVSKAFVENPAVGLVGHGISEVYPDGHVRVEVPREVCNFRITSVDAAKSFRLSKGFLGTSRMAYRREILNRIGSVPETLTFEADEYLFTLAGLFADVMILPDSFTFYRRHNANLFQLTNGDASAVWRKQRVLVALAQSLREQFEKYKVPFAIVQVVLECLDVEADLLRLAVQAGAPWDTVLTELRAMRVFHASVSVKQRLFSYLRLIPAAFLPSRTYYRWRRSITQLDFYQHFRHRYFPFPVQPHVERREKEAP
jgi:glycosyltransferase involved in cell wall biosynthesis